MRQKPIEPDPLSPSSREFDVRKKVAKEGKVRTAIPTETRVGSIPSRRPSGTYRVAVKAVN
jgi:hypothetical protein